MEKNFLHPDSKGKELARNVGYLAVGPKAFIGWVETSVKK